jgi:hypothetical protein
MLRSIVADSFATAPKQCIGSALVDTRIREQSRARASKPGKSAPKLIQIKLHLVPICLSAKSEGAHRLVGRRAEQNS